VAIPPWNSFPGARGNFSVRGLLEYRRRDRSFGIVNGILQAKD